MGHRLFVGAAAVVGFGLSQKDKSALVIGLFVVDDAQVHPHCGAVAHIAQCFEALDRFLAALDRLVVAAQVLKRQGQVAQRHGNPSRIALSAAQFQSPPKMTLGGCVVALKKGDVAFHVGRVGQFGIVFCKDGVGLHHPRLGQGDVAALHGDVGEEVVGDPQVVAIRQLVKAVDGNIEPALRIIVTAGELAE